jgi:hypothetical protein
MVVQDSWGYIGAVPDNDAAVIAGAGAVDVRHPGFCQP